MVAPGWSAAKPWVTVANKYQPVLTGEALPPVKTSFLLKDHRHPQAYAWGYRYAARYAGSDPQIFN